MNLTLAYIIIAIYSISLLLIFFYALSMLNLLINYLGYKKRNHDAPKFNLLDSRDDPYVTIQLQFTMRNILFLDCWKIFPKWNYPSNKLEIQVLDDSTDESVIETARLVKELQEKGIDIQHIRRTNRQGFKAGALKEGLEVAKGEFIAIFELIFYRNQTG